MQCFDRQRRSHPLISIKTHGVSESTNNTFHTFHAFNTFHTYTISLIPEFCNLTLHKKTPSLCLIAGGVKSGCIYISFIPKGGITVRINCKKLRTSWAIHTGEVFYKRQVLAVRGFVLIHKIDISTSCWCHLKLGLFQLRLSLADSSQRNR